MNSFDANGRERLLNDRLEKKLTGSVFVGAVSGTVVVAMGFGLADLHWSIRGGAILIGVAAVLIAFRSALAKDPGDEDGPSDQALFLGSGFNRE